MTSPSSMGATASENLPMKDPHPWLGSDANVAYDASWMGQTVG